MLTAYRLRDGRLDRMPPDAELAGALWVDLLAPDAAETARAEALGPEIPSLADMEEIEVSNRLYRDHGADYLTVVLPAVSDSSAPAAGPVTFILAGERLITVRHHAPRPFQTYPERADKTAAGCGEPEQVFLGLIEESIARVADLMEGAGRELDDTARLAFGEDAQSPQTLQLSLQRIGRVGELMGRLGLTLLTVERALSYFGQTLTRRPNQKMLREVIDGQMRDLQALDAHSEFLSGRIGLTTDTTLGMINLQQSITVRIVSVVAALFLPPTLIASIYGMNFALMPELQLAWGYPGALALMVLSAAATYFFFKWRGWL